MTITRKARLQRSPLRPSITPIARSVTPIARSPIVRKSRPPSEFARIYGSRARVRWVKRLSCVVCIATAEGWLSVAMPPLIELSVEPRSDNAHTLSGHGTGYKVGFETIVPLCRRHHRAYDHYRTPFASESPVRQFVKNCAPKIERAWQAHRASQGASA